MPLLNVSLKLPIIVGVMLWGATSYFNTLSNDVISDGGGHINNPEIFTDRADF